MKLNEFIHFNHRCPICDNDLTLYLQVKDSTCFRAQKQKNNVYNFLPFKCIDDSVSKDDHVSLYDYGNDFEIKFGNSRVADIFKRSQIYFYYLCDDQGFEKEVGADDYFISIYEGCYYRATPFLEFQKTSKKSWMLKTINPDHSSLINEEELLSFSRIVNDVEKVYMLKYHDNKVMFTHYSVSEDQKKDENYSPAVFEKEIADMPNRPNFSESNRERLLDRFDSWIILS